MEPLTSERDVSGFHSQYRDFDIFLKKKAKEFQDRGISKTFLITEKATNKICAYFSIMPGSFTVHREGKLADVPECVSRIGTIHVYYLASDDDFESEYCHIVKYIINSVRNIVLVHLREFLSVHYISLDADYEGGNSSIEEIYKNAGFTEMHSEEDYNCMILDLYSTSAFS